MKYLQFVTTLFSFVFLASFAQESTPQGHTNQNKFRQLYNELATPNVYRTASGAPGPAYYQQQADYVMELVLNDKTQQLFGDQVVTYTNNSPETLTYLWVQLDQNVRAKDGQSFDRLNNGSNYYGTQRSVAPGFVNEFLLNKKFDGGFKIDALQTTSGVDLPYTVHQTMMRIDLPTPLMSGTAISFRLKWHYNIPNRQFWDARSGYEYFVKDDNYAYFIAQFFPRMAVYNDVEGWQNQQFWGNGEFALPFGDYDVKITVPNDHIVEATGVLENRKEVYSSTMMKRFREAKKSYDEPVFIVTQDEAEANEKSVPTGTKTWHFTAKNVRDFAFASSRKFIVDMMNVDVNGNDVMAVSVYPKEGNPLWEQWSTKTVASALKSYSRMTFDYPYHKAVSVHADDVGMEYPMICFNFGRPDESGYYSDRTKFGMIGVIIHEIGHNFFPMIVNSDERQWGWMDEGLNSFVQIIAEQDFGKAHPDAIPGLDHYPSDDMDPQNIVRYMAGDQDFIAPIMSNPENVYQLGPNAYSKPATALNILRETVMGRELFDHAFKTFSQRWMFKHPTPEDFFRTMEDASAFDLDWFWRGWFFTTDVVDMGVTEVKDIKKLGDDKRYFSLYYQRSLENLTPDELKNRKENKKFYEVVFEKPGGIPMPLIVEYSYADGTKERKTYPAQVWRKNDKTVSKYIATDKELIGVVVDPDNATADINKENNNWPKVLEENDFEKFKKQQ
ncbi:MAG: M1 family metallopeptidase [Flavobacteriaceae bacterium]